jgi:hypothetical protein
MFGYLFVWVGEKKMKNHWILFVYPFLHCYYRDVLCGAAALTIAAVSFGEHCKNVWVGTEFHCLQMLILWDSTNLID